MGLNSESFAIKPFVIEHDGQAFVVSQGGIASCDDPFINVPVGICVDDTEVLIPAATPHPTETVIPTATIAVQPTETAIESFVKPLEEDGNARATLWIMTAGLAIIALTLRMKEKPKSSKPSFMERLRAPKHKKK